MKKLTKLLYYTLLFIIPFLSYPIAKVRAGNSFACHRTAQEPVKIPPHILKRFNEMKICYNNERLLSFNQQTTGTEKKPEDISPFTAPYFGTKAQIVNIINSQYLPDPKQKLEIFKKIYEFLEEGKKLHNQTNSKISSNIRYGNVKSVIASLDSSPNRTLEVKCMFFDDTCYTYHF